MLTQWTSLYLFYAEDSSAGGQPCIAPSRSINSTLVASVIRDCPDVDLSCLALPVGGCCEAPTIL